MKNRGFTLLEVLLALACFAFGVLAVVEARTGSLRNTVESERMFQAVELAEGKMNDLMLKYQQKINKDGIEGSLGKEEGTFDEPFEKFSWQVELREPAMKFTRATIEKFLGDMGVDKSEADDLAEQQRLLLGNLNKAVKDNLAELQLTVKWMEYGRKYSLPLVSHVMLSRPKIELTTELEE